MYLLKYCTVATLQKVSNKFKNLHEQLQFVAKGFWTVAIYMKIIMCMCTDSYAVNN